MDQVTVGTTSFDDLVKEVDAESFQEQAEWFLRNLWIFHFSSNFVLHVRQAKALGYKRLVVQRGRGSHRCSTYFHSDPSTKIPGLLEG